VNTIKLVAAWRKFLPDIKVGNLLPFLMMKSEVKILDMTCGMKSFEIVDKD
jgi:hypothetical protein